MMCWTRHGGIGVCSRGLIGVTEGAAAFGRAPEVHPVAAAQDRGRVVESPVASIVDADEEQVRRVETLDGPVRVAGWRFDHRQILV